jgi:hypothetical protein
MRKVELTAAAWTVVLALPFTILALFLAAITTENMSQILSWINGLSVATTIGGRGWLIEIAERWPELAGMFVGQVLLLLIILLARRESIENSETPA